MQLEIDYQHQYNAYEDMGKVQATKEHKKTRTHFVFDMKHDGRHKAMLVADGNLTDVPLSSVCSGIVSFRGIRLVLYLAELNGLESWVKDIDNAYLEVFTKDKVCIVAGPEFGPLKIHNLIIVKALHGLRTSGLRWYERLANCIRDMGCKPCKMGPEIWLCPYGEDYCKRISVSVGDLPIASKDPKGTIDGLTNKNYFKLKGTGPISYHLGCDFDRDDDGTLHFAPEKCSETMVNCYYNMCGAKPKLSFSSPLKRVTILN